MANVLLINPSIRRSYYKTPCLGLGYVGASLKKAGHSVTVADGSLYSVDVRKTTQLISELRPDYVGVSAFTLQYISAKDILRSVKRVDPSITTVFGGPHATCLTRHVMMEVPEIDFVIGGEGETAFPALIEALATRDDQYQQMAGVAYRSNGDIKMNPPSHIADLDSLEYPWQVLNIRDYAGGRGHGFTTKRLPTAPILTSRGCPNKCTFCAASCLMGQRLRLRDPKKVVDEIEYVIDTFGVREVQIVDDNFSLNREHAVQTCEEILSRGLDISWCLPNGVRADRVDYPLLKLMKQSGCYYMAFGIEFGSERMLNMTRKTLSLDKARQSVHDAASLGYITQGFFMMGHPQETKDDALATINLARKMPFDRLSINFVVPLPGSEIFEYYLQKGYLDMANVDWGQFNGPWFIPTTEHLSRKDLFSLLRRGYAQFYLDPRRDLRFLLKIRSATQMKGLWAGGKTVFTSMVRRGKW